MKNGEKVFESVDPKGVRFFYMGDPTKQEEGMVTAAHMFTSNKTEAMVSFAFLHYPLDQHHKHDVQDVLLRRLSGMKIRCKRTGKHIPGFVTVPSNGDSAADVMKAFDCWPDVHKPCWAGSEFGSKYMGENMFHNKKEVSRAES